MPDFARTAALLHMSTSGSYHTGCASQQTTDRRHDRRLNLETAAAFLVLHCGSWKKFACGLVCDMVCDVVY